MLPKKGDLRDLNNWRGIMLLDAASKIISMVINDRLQRLLKEIGIEEQNGFSGGRGCMDGSFCIRQASKKQRGNGLESRVLFVDLVKAFDSVPRDVLFIVLAKFGVPPHLIHVIKRLNADLEVTFDLGGEPVAVPCSDAAQPDPLPLRHASLPGVARGHHAGGGQAAVSNQHTPEGETRRQGVGH